MVNMRREEKNVIFNRKEGMDKVTKWKSFFLSLVIMLTFSSYASAAEYDCSGNIDYVTILNDSTVGVIASGLYQGAQASIRRDICNLSADRQGVSTSTCRSWLTTLLTARAADKVVTIRYDDALSCDTQPIRESGNAPVMLAF